MCKRGKISIIIPVYNGQAFIGRCLESIAVQTHREWEVIIVNDGSTDNTVQLVETISESHQMNVKLYSQKNAGQAAARNFGLLQAEGEYVAFLDADDYIDKDYLKQLYDTAEAYHSDVVTCGYRNVKEDGTVQTEMSVSPFAEVSDYGKAGIFVVWAKLFRREFLLQNQFCFPEGGKIYEDVPFSLETKFLGRNVKGIAYIGYNYVQRQGSTMNKGTITAERFPFDKMNEVLDKLRANDGVDQERFEFEVLHLFAGFLFFYCKKAKKADIYAMCEYAKNKIKALFPTYWKNPYLGAVRSRELPLVHRLAIQIFVWITRVGALKPFSYIITRL